MGKGRRAVDRLDAATARIIGNREQQRLDGQALEGTGSIHSLPPQQTDGINSNLKEIRQVVGKSAKKGIRRGRF